MEKENPGSMIDYQSKTHYLILSLKFLVRVAATLHANVPRLSQEIYHSSLNNREHLRLIICSAGKEQDSLGLIII